ncbi:MAG: hypothetical protein ACE5FA_09220, partial [Dehalococcoidia bacterium]
MPSSINIGPINPFGIFGKSRREREKEKRQGFFSERSKFFTGDPDLKDAVANKTLSLREAQDEQERRDKAKAAAVDQKRFQSERKTALAQGEADVDEGAFLTDIAGPIAKRLPKSTPRERQDIARPRFEDTVQSRTLATSAEKSAKERDTQAFGRRRAEQLGKTGVEAEAIARGAPNAVPTRSEQGATEFQRKAQEPGHRFTFDELRAGGFGEKRATRFTDKTMQEIVAATQEEAQKSQDFPTKQSLASILKELVNQVHGEQKELQDQGAPPETLLNEEQVIE